jgi:hypothetical protein
MTSIIMKAPPGTGRRVEMKPGFFLYLEADGTILAARLWVPDLLAKGFTRTDGVTEQVDPRTEIMNSNAGECRQFLHSREVSSVDVDAVILAALRAKAVAVYDNKP